MRSSGKSSATCSRYGIGRPGSEVHQRPGVADLQAERHVELDALGVERVVAAVVGRQAPRATARCGARGSRARARSAAARAPRPSAAPGRPTATPTQRRGCARTNAATSSLSISAPCGPHQAATSPTATPPASIARDRRLERHSGNASCRVQRSSDAKNGCSRKRARGVLHPDVDDLDHSGSIRNSNGASSAAGPMVWIAAMRSPTGVAQRSTP